MLELFLGAVEGGGLSSLRIEQWLKVLGIAGSAIVFSVGVYQYVCAQRWRRAEFVAEEVRRFRADASVGVVLMMLDYSDREYVFPGDRKGRVFRVTHDVIARSLRAHEAGANFTELEAYVRDLFDVYFDALERLDQFVQADLVSKTAFKPYLGYYFSLMVGGGSGVEPCLVGAIAGYVRRYEFVGVERLLSCSGCPMRE